VSRTLEAYLEEVSHYLAVRAGAEDILSEIRSHILEKTESEHGSITEDALSRIIKQYGPPQVVASKYLEGIKIISPIFLRHLTLYTGLLFAVHLLLFLIAAACRLTIVGVPFLYVPAMDDWHVFFYVPMALIYDLGLVVLFLSFVTRYGPAARLPWPRVFDVGESIGEVARPGIVAVTARALLFAVFSFLFLRFGTCFFVSMNDLRSPVPMFGRASHYVSLVFLAILASETVGYAARYISRSRWVNLAANGAILLLLQFLWNSPVPIEYPAVRGISIRPVVIAALSCITAVILFRFLRDLLLVGKRRLANPGMGRSS
jgi:hypothetical protein